MGHVVDTLFIFVVLSFLEWGHLHLLWCLSWKERTHLTPFYLSPQWDCKMRSSCHACRVNGKAPGEDCASLISAEDRGAGLGVQQSAAPLVKQHMLYFCLFIGMRCPFQSVMETFVFQVQGKASVELKTFLQFKAETHQQRRGRARQETHFLIWNQLREGLNY